MFRILTSLAFAFLLSVPACLASESSDPIPSDPGMYLKNSSGQWQELEADVFTWRVGGVLKFVLTDGFVKGDLNARVRQGTADIRASFDDEFLVVVPSGTSIKEYQMVQFHQHRHSREFRLITGAIFHMTSGSDRDDRDFGYTKIAPHAYLVQFKRYEGGGEFGFVPPPAFSPAPYAEGKIYCFHMRN